jgi:hypothetical protein
MNWDQLVVESVIVHYVPTARDDPTGTVLLTDAPIPMDPALHQYFREKIASRLEDNGLASVNDPEVQSPAPQLVEDIVADATRLVDGSKVLAAHLDTIQTGNNSSGLLAVATASLEGKNFVAIIKLEKERGIRFAINQVNGQNVVDMELLRNLTLTDKTKVYKTAILGLTDAGSAHSVEGYVADDQRGRTDGVQVATFFLSRFLGCKPKAPAARLTFDFVRATNKMISDSVSDSETKGKYQVALLSTMQDNTGDLRPREFAENNLAPEHREPFFEQLEKVGIDRATVFPKDTSIVKVSRFKMTFESGMVLVGSREDLEEKVEIPSDPGPENPVKLKDGIDDVLTAR